MRGRVTEGPGRNLDPRVVRTRTAVLEAAIDLLAERGYSGFSVEGVVEATGIAKTTLYRHWPSRDDLLIAVIAELGGTGPVPDTGSAAPALQDFFPRRVQTAHSRQWERCMPALVEAAPRHPELAKMVADLTTQALGQIEDLLRRGVERGELRPDFDPQTAASALMGSIVLRRLLLHEAPTAQRVSAAIDIVMQGIAPSQRKAKDSPISAS